MVNQLPTEDLAAVIVDLDKANMDEADMDEG